MNRLDFMKELERLLSDISESERQEALQYYNDYLNDAGVENEEEVIASLGSPEKVAATIKAGLSGGEEGAFTENGYRDYEEEKKNTVAVQKMPENQQESAGEQWNGSAYSRQSGQQNGNDSVNGRQDDRQNEKEHEQQHTRQAGKRKMSSGMLILVIILCIFCSPFLFGLGAGVLVVAGGLLITIIAVIFSLLIGAGAVAFALLITGIVLLGVAIAKLFVSPLGGVSLLAAGMICVGIGLLFLALTVWIVGKLVPAVIRFIVDIFSRLFHRKGGVAA